MTTISHAEERGGLPVKINLKLGADVYEALKERAKKADRTVAAEIRRALREYVEAESR